MSNAPWQSVWHELRRRAVVDEAAGLSDSDLLIRFVRQRDESAFEALVARHGSLVRGVCRRMLRQSADVDDACQATFLALARLAKSIRRGACLRSWLHQVAYRTARRLRRQQGGRTEWSTGGLAAAVRPDPLDGAETAAILHDEVRRLPARYRQAVVRCYLAGESTAEAARHLGVPRGTVLSRLAWARKRLRVRLAGRGLTLGAGVFAVLRSGQTGAAGALVGWTRAAGSGPAVQLMEGVVHEMFFSKLRLTTGVALALIGLGLLGGFWLSKPAAQAEPPGRTAAAQQAPPAVEEPLALRDGRPLGTWERDTGICRTTLRFEADRVFGTAVVRDDNKQQFTVVMDADYTVTKDHLLVGVITGIDIPEGGDEAAELASLLDHTFSCRVRIDENQLTIKDIKALGSGTTFAGGEKEIDEALLMLAGRYKRKGDLAADDVPAAPRKRTRPTNGGAVGALSGTMIGRRTGPVAGTGDGAPVLPVGVNQGSGTPR